MSTQKLSLYPSFTFGPANIGASLGGVTGCVVGLLVGGFCGLGLIIFCKDTDPLN